jgi:hypothetical protein
MRRPTSPTYRQVAEALVARSRISCLYGGFPRELCPIVMGWGKRGEEKVLTYQVGGRGSKPLPPGGAWRCFEISGMSDVRLSDGPWIAGSSHVQPQGCVDEVDLDINPDSPYRPKRSAAALGEAPKRKGPPKRPLKK